MDHRGRDRNGGIAAHKKVNAIVVSRWTDSLDRGEASTDNTESVVCSPLPIGYTTAPGKSRSYWIVRCVYRIITSDTDGVLDPRMRDSKTLESN